MTFAVELSVAPPRFIPLGTDFAITKMYDVISTLPVGDWDIIANGFQDVLSIMTVDITGNVTARALGNPATDDALHQRGSAITTAQSAGSRNGVDLEISNMFG